MALRPMARRGADGGRGAAARRRPLAAGRAGGDGARRDPPRGPPLPGPARGAQAPLAFLSVSHGELVLYGAFVWARRVRKRRFLARAVGGPDDPQPPTNLSSKADTHLRFGALLPAG
jgi:hypothetical protein